MKRIAVMQPYFLPYIGYFHLMAAVDRLVLLDDVAFINRGWIARNRIPINGRPAWVTLPLSGASQNRLIQEIEIMPDEGWKPRTVRTVQRAYAEAAYANQMLPVFEELIADATGNLSAFLCRSLRRVADLVGLRTEILPTSSVYPKGQLKGQERILDICRREGALVYVNAAGGQSLYDPARFKEAGIALGFVDPGLAHLKVRHSLAEGPVLSILDLLMLNPPEAVLAAMQDCKLVSSSKAGPST